MPELENPLMGETITLEQAASEPIPDGSLDVLLPNNELDMDPDDLQMGNPPSTFALTFFLSFFCNSCLHLFPLCCFAREYFATFVQ